MKNNTLKLTTAALIAAAYVVLTMMSQFMGLASGAVQLRLSEALTILPVFTSAAVPGLAIGCLISNIVTGCSIADIIFGTLATLAGAATTSKLGKKNPYLGPVGPILANMIILPLTFRYIYGAEGSYLYFLLTIGIGEIISCGVLGLALYKGLKGKINWVE